MKKLAEIRRRGYAVSVQERYSFTAGVAAPCLFERDVIGSLAVIGPAERIKATGLERIGKTVKSIAGELSARHGASGVCGDASSPGRRLRLVR